MQEVFVKDEQDLRKWLQKNHTQKEAVWLVFTKGEHRTMSIGQIVDQLLCFGWVDSKSGTVDDTKSKLTISPRNPKSNWSARNKENVERLTKAGLMTPAGQAMIDLAKKTGTWDALNDVENLVIPKDLESEFKKYKHAKENFLNFPRSVKRANLEWLLNAKLPETRQKRIHEIASLAEDNKRANQFVKKS